jgi:hypothetical protein
MNVSDLSTSNYLSRKETGDGVGLLLTVKSVEHENIAGDNQAENMKYVMFFNEQEKGLVLNKTNGTIMAAIAGSPESENWIGKKCVAYFDASIMYKGEVKGGIRLRKPVLKAAQPAKQPVTKPAPVAAVDLAEGNPPDDLDMGADVSDMPF